MVFKLSCIEPKDPSSEEIEQAELISGPLFKLKALLLSVFYIYMLYTDLVQNIPLEEQMLFFFKFKSTSQHSMFGIIQIFAIRHNHIIIIKGKKERQKISSLYSYYF